MKKTEHPETWRLLWEADSAPEGNHKAHLASFDSSLVDCQDELGRTLLHKAALIGRPVIAGLLLKSQANPELADQMGRTALHYAAQQTNLDITRVLIETGKINMVDILGKSPLYLAAEAGNTVQVQEFVTSQAEFVASYKGRTPLHAAAISGSADTVRILLNIEKGRRLISAQDVHKKTAIHIAAKKGHVGVVDELLKDTLDLGVIDAQDNDEWTALFLASEKGHFEIVQSLINAGSIIYHTDQLNNTAIHLAAENGHLDIVRYLLSVLSEQVKLSIEKWYQVDWPQNYSQYAFIAALIKAGALGNSDGNDEGLKLDHSKWATLEERQKLHAAIVSSLRTFDDEQFSTSGTVLMPAVQGGHIDIVKLLLSEVPEMPLQAANYCFSNVLSLAAGRGYLEIASLLIEAGSEVDAITERQETCLHAAAENGHCRMVELLLQYGANPDLARRRDGFTPLHLASKGGHVTAVRVLLDVSFINAADDMGRTPLHIACLEGQDDIVNLLLDAEVDLSTPDIDDKTPLELVKGLNNTTQMHMKEQARKQRQRQANGYY